MDSWCTLIEVLWSLEFVLTSYLCAAILELLGASPKTAHNSIYKPRLSQRFLFFSHLFSSSRCVRVLSYPLSPGSKQWQIKCALCIWPRWLLHFLWRISPTHVTLSRRILLAGRRECTLLWTLKSFRQIRALWAPQTCWFGTKHRKNPQPLSHIYIYIWPIPAYIHLKDVHFIMRSFRA